MRIRFVGDWVGNETHADQDVVKVCVEAFESAWNIAVPHHEYNLK